MEYNKQPAELHIPDGRSQEVHRAPEQRMAPVTIGRLVTRFETPSLWLRQQTYTDQIMRIYQSGKKGEILVPTTQEITNVLEDIGQLFQLDSEKMAITKTVDHEKTHAAAAEAVHATIKGYGVYLHTASDPANPDGLDITHNAFTITQFKKDTPAIAKAAVYIYPQEPGSDDRLATQRLGFDDEYEAAATIVRCNQTYGTHLPVPLWYDPDHKEIQ